VVNGSYFDVVGLHPVLGRLIGPEDDGPKAPGVVVLTYHFWSGSLKSDPSVIGKVLRLGSGFGDRSATIIGVLEPSVQYPTNTEIIANIVTSPHHLSATMQNGRVHTMTELFGKLTPRATLGVLSARPMVDIMARYASRFSVRALDLTVDSSMLWVGAALAVVAAVLLAFVPRLPSADSSQGISLSNGSVRITGSTNRRLRIFAVTQIAASFVLLAGASALVKTLLSLQSAQTGLDIRHVLAINVPAMSYGK